MEMSYIVDFKNVSTVGLKSLPVVEALAGLRANEARYFMNKYEHEFTVVPASESQEILDYVNRILPIRWTARVSLCSISAANNTT
jgi:hypothetical protein